MNSKHGKVYNPFYLRLKQGLSDRNCTRESYFDSNFKYQDPIWAKYNLMCMLL